MDYLKFINHQESKLIFRNQEPISVFQQKSYRWILFNQRFIQTMINIHKPHKIILPYLHSLLLFSQHNPGSVLLFGLGGGAAVHNLYHHHPNLKLTIVEKHPDMIKIAKKFFFLPNHPNLSVFCADANDYVNATNQKYKHILIDLGDEQGFPVSCRNQDFFANTYRLLETNGILCLNVSRAQDIKSFKLLLKTIFKSEPLVIQASGNWILVNSKQGRNHPLDLLYRLNMVKTHAWQSNFGEFLELRQGFESWLYRTFTKYFQSNNIDTSLHHHD
jgi:hypothetical protein